MFISRSPSPDPHVPSGLVPPGDGVAIFGVDKQSRRCGGKCIVRLLLLDKSSPAADLSEGRLSTVCVNHIRAHHTRDGVGDTTTSYALYTLPSQRPLHQPALESRSRAAAPRVRFDRESLTEPTSAFVAIARRRLPRRHVTEGSWEVLSAPIHLPTDFCGGTDHPVCDYRRSPRAARPPR
jgi:hypothetical protein